MALACGVDVGGTKIACGVVDTDGKILEELRVESPARSSEAIEEAIAGLVAELRIAARRSSAVGVGAAGYVDQARSTVMFAPNIAWRDVRLKAELEARTGLPVVVENDANAAAWGEFAFGAGHDVDDLLMLTIGTGVGGGLVLDGELYRGAFGVGAEIGHLRVVPDGILCGCGNRGCFEQYASGSALVRDARAAARDVTLAGAASALLELAGGDPDLISGPVVTGPRRPATPSAVAQLSVLGRWIGEGIASLTTVLDPAVVVIGGGVSEAGELLLAPIRRAFLSSLPVGASGPCSRSGGRDSGTRRG